jgi:hypothetical protein
MNSVPWSLKCNPYQQHHRHVNTYWKCSLRFRLSPTESESAF